MHASLTAPQTLLPRDEIRRRRAISSCHFVVFSELTDHCPPITARRRALPSTPAWFSPPPLWHRIVDRCDGGAVGPLSRCPAGLRPTDSQSAGDHAAIGCCCCCYFCQTLIKRRYFRSAAVTASACVAMETNHIKLAETCAVIPAKARDRLRATP